MLPDYRPEDVVGSPYCVRDYRSTRAWAGATAWPAPAPRWPGTDWASSSTSSPTTSHPTIRGRARTRSSSCGGSSQELEDDPGSFVAIDGSVLARGRDPYFPAWPDVVQLNAFAPALRATVVDTLRDIAEQCDGVRCDMAMLMMNDVFARTWGARVGTPPARGLLAGGHSRRARARIPDFRFIAEAYWDLEWALQQQGFDFCYDKRLYDRLVAARSGRSGPTCPRTGSISSGWSGSSRTTTSRGPPRCSTTVGNGPRR